MVTGHDADLHCVHNTRAQCHWFNVAVAFVRSGAPDPSRPVLVLDRGALQVGVALDHAFPPAGSVPRIVVDPRSPKFASTAIDSANFSALVVASDSTCGGCGLNDPDGTPDSDALDARQGEIAAFLNAGGGVLALAGANHGDGKPANGADRYYSFVPVPTGRAAHQTPVTLTAAGAALGFGDSRAVPPIGVHDDVNCCQTHNSFALPPPGSALRVAEIDGKGFPVTLFSSAPVTDVGIVSKPPRVAPIDAADVILLPPDSPATRAPGSPSTLARECVGRRRLRIRLRRPGRRRIEQAIVRVNGKRVKVVRGRRVRAPIVLRGLPRRRFTLEVTVITTTGRVITRTRRYRACRARGGRAALS